MYAYLEEINLAGTYDMKFPNEVQGEGGGPWCGQCIICQGGIIHL